MPENSLATPRDVPVGLDPEIKNKLQTWEDFISCYTQLSEASNSVSWVKADLMLALSEKFGETSVEQFSKDINEPRSTIDGYIRTAKAFPAERRELRVSFSHHFQASFADHYDDKKSEFIGETRYNWVEKAADDKLSTRELQRQIQVQKEKALPDAKPPTCLFCKQEGIDVREYVIFSPGSKDVSIHLRLHPLCLENIVNWIENHTE